MSYLSKSYRLEDMPEGDNYGPLPPGWYDARIKSSELKHTKNGDGQYLSIQYEILGPEHVGRVVFGNLNIRNKNIQAQEIAEKQLGDIMRSSGLKEVQQSEDLIGATLKIELSIRPPQNGYDATNDIKKFKPMESMSSNKVSVGSDNNEKSPWS